MAVLQTDRHGWMKRFIMAGEVKDNMPDCSISFKKKKKLQQENKCRSEKSPVYCRVTKKDNPFALTPTAQVPNSSHKYVFELQEGARVPRENPCTRLMWVDCTNHCTTMFVTLFHIIISYKYPDDLKKSLNAFISEHKPSLNGGHLIG